MIMRCAFSPFITLVLFSLFASICCSARFLLVDIDSEKNEPNKEVAKSSNEENSVTTEKTPSMNRMGGGGGSKEQTTEKNSQVSKKPACL